MKGILRKLQGTSPKPNFRKRKRTFHDFGTFVFFLYRNLRKSYTGYSLLCAAYALDVDTADPGVQLKRRAGRQDEVRVFSSFQ